MQAVVLFECNISFLLICVTVLINYCFYLNEFSFLNVLLEIKYLYFDDSDNIIFLI